MAKCALWSRFRDLLTRFLWRFVVIFIVSMLLSTLFNSAHAHANTRRRHDLRTGFELFVSRDEMNRTLGILTEMNYVHDGIVNAYSTKFPYRISENISHLLFTWYSHNSNVEIKYSLRAIAEDFDIVPVLHIPKEGFLPHRPQTFAVEYRCAGSRAGQFQVTLHADINWPSENEPTRFTLKQEKICAALEARRGTLDTSAAAASDQPFDARQLILAAAAICGVLVIILSVLICTAVRHNELSRKTHNCSEGGLAPLMGAGAAAHSFYTAAAMLGKSGFNDHITPTMTNFCAATTTTIARLSTSTPATTIAPSAHPPPLLQPTASSSSAYAVSLGGVVDLDDAIHSNSSDYKNDFNSENITYTPYAGLKVPIFDTLNASIDQPKIIFERRGNSVDIRNALVELNADRNLFVMMPQIELEGKFGEIRWTNWRQTGIGTSGDIDDEEDDVNEDTALICKMLKPNADRAHFETFLRDALALHNVPAHPNLAQVIAAATFGNFNNPNSVADFPLICYRHSGFGILKKFLCTCRGINAAAAAAQNAHQQTRENNNLNESTNIGAQSNNTNTTQQKILHKNLLNPTLRVHDLVSIAIQLVKAVQHLHTFGIIHKDIATRNCLISEVPIKHTSSEDRLYVQLADNALSKDIFADEYFEMPNEVEVDEAPSLSPSTSAAPSTSKSAMTSLLADDERLNTKCRTDLFPVKWMAPEAIRSKIFNSSTDVWTLGMFMWELFTCGQIPFADVDLAQLVLAIAGGARPSQPSYNCPDEIYGIMFTCWHYDPLQRPGTAQLLGLLNEFAHQLRRYI